MHQITSISALTKQKSKVCIDHDMTIALYKGEIRRFHMEEGGELSDSDYDEIFHTILPKRMKERVANLLMRRQMTHQEVVRKLKEGYYPEDLIEETIALFEKHHYIDDANYSESFLTFRNRNKSKKQLQQDLLKKGVDRETIASALEESDVDDGETIRILMRKKHFDPKEATKEERQKFCMSLMRKGFSYETISKIVGESYESM
ncbi:MAG: recombination regulator RecX [Lachnospiraceae bacterium]|nr:recombination regulator RecX [Lachnospiraceae bacterium]